MVDTQTGLTSLLKELKLRKQLPQNMDVAQLGDRFWFVCHDQDRSNIISESSTTGFSEDANVALLKALSERVERIAFRQGYKEKLKSCMTDRSDGFAAYPQFYKDADVKARESALCEAIERYVWATWWDDESIAFGMESISATSDELKIKPYVSIIKDQCELEEIFVIQPKVENANNKSVTILFGRLRNGGFVSGGACGDNLKNNLLRSLDELYRHALAIKNMKTKNAEAITFYEKRLAYFGFGNGNHLIRKRLEANGKKSIVLPNLKIDEPIRHELEDLFLVHRCYFENQPAFVGGAMERLCL